MVSCQRPFITRFLSRKTFGNIARLLSSDENAVIGRKAEEMDKLSLIRSGFGTKMGSQEEISTFHIHSFHKGRNWWWKISQYCGIVQSNSKNYLDLQEKNRTARAKGARKQLRNQVSSSFKRYEIPEILRKATARRCRIQLNVRECRGCMYMSVSLHQSLASDVASQTSNKHARGVQSTIGHVIHECCDRYMDDTETVGMLSLFNALRRFLNFQKKKEIRVNWEGEST